jgi:hypothetical protein
MVGVSPNREDSIKIRKSSTFFVYPVSFADKFLYDNKTGKYSEGKQKLSNAAYGRWFNSVSMKRQLQSMIGISEDDIENNQDYITEVFFNLREKMTEVIKRIDPEFVSLVQHISINMNNILEI